MIPASVHQIAAAAAPGDPAVAGLLARPDAEETLERIAGALPPDEFKPDLVVVLTALTVLRARQAAERIGKRIGDAALGGEVKAW